MTTFNGKSLPQFGPSPESAQEALLRFKAEQEVKQKPLHPLHSIEFLVDMMRHTGRYPDTERCTGRSTILALRFLTKALETPFKPINVLDHYPTRASSERLTYEIGRMAERLGLKHVYINVQACTVVFGKL